MVLLHRGGVRIAALHADDFRNPLALEAVLGEIIRRTGPAPVVLDISSVDEVTELGVAALCAAETVASSCGARLIVAGARRRVHDRFVSSGAQVDLRVCSSVDQAIRMLELLPPGGAGDGHRAARAAGPGDGAAGTG